MKVKAKSKGNVVAAREAYENAKKASIAARARLAPGASEDLQDAARKAKAAAVEAKLALREAIAASR